MDRTILYETYRLAMLIDLIKPEDLIQKIDEYITEKPIEEIPHVFYVLSLSSNRRRMLELLTDLSKGVDQDLPSCIVAGLLHREQERFGTEELYRKAGMLASLLADQDEEVAVEFTHLKAANDAAQQAYGMRFKRKKARERMLAKNEKDLKDALAKYEKYTGFFNDQDWGK
ncbi:hypothetical protein QWY16_17020 [Planococcus shenhongbingii]|uniref:Uncharacterized protein n=1 Tax=Planococcus shenhongbingii TaxID=3058398 RepID=A0ABT8NB16_9BACL|nr:MULTISPECIES: hypothetical protein [unclassified Planococcus (in: firmicutes)]MDN7245083.1 hypothetical protein [Planococcus sp. N017]WKA58178.1 hypothetical protein QWY16_17020 [Planococcus sp. N016]